MEMGMMKKAHVKRNKIQYFFLLHDVENELKEINIFDIMTKRL